MFKRNHIFTSLLATSLVLSSSFAMAEESITTNAGVTVTNAFNFDKVSDLSFGVIRATQDNTATAGAGIRLLTDGTNEAILADTPTGVSEVSSLSPGTPAEYTIDSAAANTRLTLGTISAVELVALGGSTGTFDLVIDTEDFTVVRTDGTEVEYNGFNLITDATGAVGLKMGGKLNIIETLTTVPDGEYTISFPVTVDY